MPLHEQTVAIAVIGVAGSGKSTFINLASGSNSPVRKSLGSSTTELESSTFSLDGRTVTLIDTPGFDDSSTPSVLDVLKLISDYFSRLYSQGVKLAGVIYMHCLSEDHMGGPSRHNFHTFSKFCGDTTLRDVVIVTSNRAVEKPIDGDERERECAHKDECFMNAIDKGARMLRHDGSQASAHAILRHLINRDAMPPAHEESSDQREEIGRTSTDADAVRELTDQVEHHTKAFGELCRGIDAAQLVGDEGTRDALQEEAKSSLETIEHIRYDLERMVTKFAAENTRLEDENRRFKSAFTAQKTEAELRTRLLGEARRARELAEAERGRAEAQLAEGRALWEREKIEKESLRVPVQPKHRYGKLFTCGAVIFALVCASRFVLDGSTTLLL